MKKIIIVAILILTIFVSCSKSEDIQCYRGEYYNKIEWKLMDEKCGTEQEIKEWEDYMSSSTIFQQYECRFTKIK